MKAKVVDIETNEIVVKSESGKFFHLPSKKVKFNCKLNQIVCIEKDADRFYILPSNSKTFAESSATASTAPQSSNARIAIIILSITCVVIPIIMFFWAKSFFYNRGYHAAVIDKEGDYGRGWKIGFDGGKQEGLNQGYADGYKNGFSHAQNCAIRIVDYGENITFDDCWDSLRK